MLKTGLKGPPRYVVTCRRCVLTLSVGSMRSAETLSDLHLTHNALHEIEIVAKDHFHRRCDVNTCECMIAIVRTVRDLPQDAMNAAIATLPRKGQ